VSVLVTYIETAPVLISYENSWLVDHRHFCLRPVFEGNPLVRFDAIKGLHYCEGKMTYMEEVRGII